MLHVEINNQFQNVSYKINHFIIVHQFKAFVTSPQKLVTLGINSPQIMQCHWLIAGKFVEVGNNGPYFALIAPPTFSGLVPKLGHIWSQNVPFSIYLSNFVHQISMKL